MLLPWPYADMKTASNSRLTFTSCAVVCSFYKFSQCKLRHKSAYYSMIASSRLGRLEKPALDSTSSLRPANIATNGPSRTVKITHCGSHDMAAEVVVSLDVEYVHLRRTAFDPWVICPGEVALWTASGALLHTYVHPGEAVGQLSLQQLLKHDSPIPVPARFSVVFHAPVGLVFDDSICSLGGVQQKHWQRAPCLDEVAETVRAAVQGRTIVGHGLTKDLNTLGVIHPQSLKVDIALLPLFLSRAGQAQKLQKLAKEFLNKSIQTKCGQHSALEDASAVFQLYSYFVEKGTDPMDATILEAQLVKEILQHHSKVQRNK